MKLRPSLRVSHANPSSLWKFTSLSPRSEISPHTTYMIARGVPISYEWIDDGIQQKKKKQARSSLIRNSYLARLIVREESNDVCDMTKHRQASQPASRSFPCVFGCNFLRGINWPWRERDTTALHALKAFWLARASSFPLERRKKKCHTIVRVSKELLHLNKKFYGW